MVSWQAQIDQFLDNYRDQLIQLRRHLHIFPEPSGEEYKTSMHLYQMLGDFGFSVWLGPEGCGVVADPKTEPSESQKIALRADIDALRIHDQKNVVYRSQNDGFMHACGHDVHTSVVFGAITAVEALRKEDCLPWPVSFRAIFQPAEETCEGARRMITAGAIDNVEAILAIHVDPSRLIGRIGIRESVLTAGCDEIVFQIAGQGGHGARPHQARDPIHAAALLIQSIYANIPRVTDSQEAVVVTIGQIAGGHSCNVIPESVELHGTIRTLADSVRTETIRHIREIASGVAQISGTEIDVLVKQSAPAVINDPRLTDTLRATARDILGVDSVDEIPRPSMGSEDFAYYLQRIPGAMLRLGCVTSNDAPQLHTPCFDIDERAILIGAKILARAVIQAARPSTLISGRTGKETA